MSGTKFVIFWIEIMFKVKVMVTVYSDMCLAIGDNTNVNNNKNVQVMSQFFVKINNCIIIGSQVSGFGLCFCE